MKIQIMKNYIFYLLILLIFLKTNQFKNVKKEKPYNPKINITKFYPLFDRNTNKYQTRKYTAFLWNQCGGIGWNGPIICESKAKCRVINIHFHQCVPKRY